MWKKVTLLLLAMLFALSILPGGFSARSDRWIVHKEIKGTVHTGKWTDDKVAEPESAAIAPTPDTLATPGSVAN